MRARLAAQSFLPGPRACSPRHLPRHLPCSCAAACCDDWHECPARPSRPAPATVLCSSGRGCAWGGRLCAPSWSRRLAPERHLQRVLSLQDLKRHVSRVGVRYHVITSVSVQAEVPGLKRLDHEQVISHTSMAGVLTAYIAFRLER